MNIFDVVPRSDDGLLLFCTSNGEVVSVPLDMIDCVDQVLPSWRCPPQVIAQIGRPKLILHNGQVFTLDQNWWFRIGLIR